MTRPLPRIIVSLVALLAVLMAACSPAAAPAPTAAPAATAAPAVATKPAAAGTPAAAGAPTAAAAGATQTITFGIMSPNSGSAAFIGVPFQRGVEMAVEDINAKGGITVGGQKYTLKSIAYDDKYTAEGGAAAAQKAIYEDKIKFIIGPQGSAAVLAAQPITEKEKVLTAVASVTDKDTTPQSPYTFQGILSSLETTYAFYKKLNEMFPNVKRVAVIDPNDETGWADADRIERQLKDLGMEVVAKEFFQRGTTDFYPTLTKVLAKNPDALDTAASSPQGTPAKQIRELGFKGLIWGSGVDAASLIQTGGAGAEGYLAHFMGPDYYGADIKAANPSLAALAERYKAKYNEPVTAFYWEQSYGATMMYAAGIQAAQSLDTTKVAEAMRKDGFSWDTMWPDVKGKMMGEKTYGIRSIAATPFYLTQIKNGVSTMIARTVNEVP